MAGLRVTGWRLGRTLFILIWLALLPLAVGAQTSPTATLPILVVDQERLFSGSAFGRASIAREEAATHALEAENGRIQAELVAEEQELTRLRRTLSAEDFARQAEAFDRKVERIRAEQDNKARDLARLREVDGNAFLQAIVPVLGEILADRGALVILDKSEVIVSRSVIDITDEAIARVDRVLGPGATPAP